MVSGSSIDGSPATTQPPLDRSDFHWQPTRYAGARLNDRYEIIGLLGHGGTSDVYLAEDVQRRRLVIVKALLAQAASNPDVRARFLAEAHATMRIEHPNVVRVLGVEQPEGARPYLVIEALRGEPLGEYLRREGRIAWDLALILAREIAAGLAAAHRVGVIHRDVKPDNLFLVGPRGSPHGLRIVDFGFAKMLERGGASTANLVVGTAQYMAPEQVLCDPIDSRTDVYALGVVMFLMFTGQLPFDVEPGADLLSHQLFSPTPPPSWLEENLDPRVESIILRAMRKHPENRYPSMDALLRDLEIALGVVPDSEIPRVPLARFPDLYRPRNPQGREVAELLADRFGAEPLPPPSSLLVEKIG